MERGLNIDGERYEVNITGQAYSQAKVFSAVAAIVYEEAPTEEEMPGNQLSR